MIDEAAEREHKIRLVWQALSEDRRMGFREIERRTGLCSYAVRRCREELRERKIISYEDNSVGTVIVHQPFRGWIEVD